MKLKRSKKRWAWKKKHIFTHYINYNFEKTKELTNHNENSEWRLWTRYIRYNNAPKSFVKQLQKRFKNKSKIVTRKQLIDYENENLYEHQYLLFKKDANYKYW